jgi:G3E family GTPase
MTTSDRAAPASVVPLTILTGFLGSGKTTLLNRLLNGDHGLRVAVLVNDFGAVNIDADLVVGVEEDMISLANGCVCCQIRDDLIRAVDSLLEGPNGDQAAAYEAPEYIVLEASGVADPAGIWATFTDSDQRDRIRLDSVTCVVDAEQILAHVDDAPELMMLKARQIGFADMVVLNKTDLAGPAQVDWVRRWIDQMMNRVRVVEASYCDIPHEVLLGVGRFDPTAHPDLAAEDTGGDHADHGAQFDTWAYESATPFSAEALEEMIRRDLPGEVYRCKGIIYLDGEDDQPMALQSVGRRSEITPVETGAGGASGLSRIVAIGAAGRVDHDALREAFDGCLAS